MLARVRYATSRREPQVSYEEAVSAVGTPGRMALAMAKDRVSEEVAYGSMIAGGDDLSHHVPPYTGDGW